MDGPNRKPTQDFDQVSDVRFGGIVTARSPPAPSVESTAVCDESIITGEGAALWLPITNIRATAV